MKKITILFACVFAQLYVCAQTVEFIEPRNVQSITAPEFQTFHVKDHIYMLYNMFDMHSPIMHDIQLDAYDAAMKPVGSYQIDKTLDPGDANIYEGIFALTDNLVMFKSGYTKGTGSTLKYYPFNVAGSRGTGTDLVTFPAEKAMNSGNFEVNVSEDGTKIAVLCELPHVKDSLEKTIVYVFDNNFKQLWKKEYTFPYESEKAPHNDVYVSNTGSVFDLKQIAVKKATDTYSAFTFLANGTVVERKIDLGTDGMITSYKAVGGTNGDIIFAGYYIQNKKVAVDPPNAIGTFYIKVSAVDGGMPYDKINVFAAHTNIKARYLFAYPDNSVVLVGDDELSSSTIRPGANATDPNAAYDYDYDNSNINAVKMGPDGTKAWEYIVTKDMKSRNDGGRFICFGASMMGTNLVLTYQDFYYKHDGKQHPTVDGYYGSWRADVIETVNADGGKAGEKLITDQRIGGQNGEYMFLPATQVTAADNTLFFISMRGLELVGTKVTL
ncbi:MAG TPA: hypothetical protein VL651_12405 [Bacteroidia bacterium]|jgi:hypothetical protein|nr:hypothetical protein [Bacteroidia bacterium]